MARHTEPVCKLCRNESKKLFLKGNRCNSQKCAFEKKPYRSGQHGQGRKKLSEYAIQLREKNKLRRSYLITEKQFFKYFKQAENKTGVTGTILLQLLESRLDSVVFRSGLVQSKPQARQLVNHRHFTVNGRIVDIPSYMVKPGDVIAVKTRSSKRVKEFIEETPIEPANWVKTDKDKLTTTFDSVPRREDLDPEIKEQLIIEFYSR
ncbi:MAG: 30S ribosomal protein S4 [Vampirovibrionia bacterium]